MHRESKLLEKLKTSTKKLKQNLYVLYWAYKDARVPWHAKLFAICVVAYAFSPIDLIPDFIPILGYLDDLIIVPLGITIALKLIPQNILDEYRVKAEEMRSQGKPKNWITGTLFIIIWIASAIWIGEWLYRFIA